jgi:hypothetical protein
MPFLLAIIDIVIERGGSVGFKDFKLDFSVLVKTSAPEFTVPANIGVQGVPVYESNTREILDALKKAKKSNIVVIDIEDGTAWWETRLLVLLAGATRLGTPGNIVFVGKTVKGEQQFIGWAEPGALLGKLLEVRPVYKQAFYTAVAAAKQWAMVEPAVPPAMAAEPFPFGNAAIGKNYIAFDPLTGLPNEFTQEEFFQNELGMKVEAMEQNKTTLHVTRGKLHDIFDGELIEDRLDQAGAKEEMARIFFETDFPWVALTENGKYLRMVSRLSVINEIIKTEIKGGNSRQAMQKPA